MERRQATTVAGGVAVVLLLAAGLLALLRPSATVVVDGRPPVTVPDDGTGVVADLSAPGGVALFGISIIDPTHTVEVQFTTAPGCSAVVSPGDVWPSPRPECAGPDGLEGTVGGLGTTQTGRSLIGVRFDVGRDCFERLHLGMVWTPGGPAGCGG